jgi:hypothetical protein
VQQELERVLELQPQYARGDTAAMKRRGELVRHTLPNWLERNRDDLSSAAGVPLEDFVAEGSDGTGLKARIPWARFASKRASPSAKEGFDVVYLFDALGERVYLSLNQGTSEGDSFKPQPAQQIEARTTWAREILAAWLNEREDILAIELLDHRGSLSRAYECGNVAAIAYTRGLVPDDDVLLDQARDYAGALGELYRAHDRLPLPGEAPEVAHAVELAERAAGKPTHSGGAGFRTDAKEIKAIELHAVAVALSYYEAKGWKVDVLGKPYDLRLSRGGETVHVEVKGTTSTGSQVVLTYNEVRHHRVHAPANALVVVREIVLDRSSSPPTASGGTLHEIRGWQIAPSDLTPISYAYMVPKELFCESGVQADAILGAEQPRTGRAS